MSNIGLEGMDQFGPVLNDFWYSVVTLVNFSIKLYNFVTGNKNLNNIIYIYLYYILKRPCVAGAVLQIPSILIQSLTHGL